MRREPMQWPVIVAVGLALGLATTACSGTDGATVLVEVRTDLLPGVEFASVRTTLENPAQGQDRAVVRGEDLSEATRVAEFTGVPLGARVVVLRLVDIDGREVATRRARISLNGDIGVALTVTRSCAGVSCGVNETCSGGSCVSESCIEGVTGDLCEPECAEATDCPAMAACAAPRCAAGLCLYGQLAEACGANEYCDVASGCAALPVTDAGPLDSGAVDSAGADTGVVDSGTPDSAMADSGSADSAMDAGGDAGAAFVCGAAPDPGTIAVYRMNSFPRGQLLDASLRHLGSFPAGVADLVAGPPMCSNAYQGASTIHAMIPASPAFRVAEGSVDFWWLPPAPSTNATGLLSRDAIGSSMPGHFTFYYGGESGRLVARIQNGMADLHRCTFGGVAPGVWHHVGLNFGPGGFDLYLDGVEQRGTGTWRHDSFAPIKPCELDPITVGLDGNDNPWVIGASSATSTEGTADMVRANHDGALDEVRFSSVRRDFTVLAP